MLDMPAEARPSPQIAAPIPARISRWRGAAAATAATLGILFTAPLAFAAGPDGFADLVDKVKPAVVNIATTLKTAGRPGARGQVPIPPELRGTPFEDFLRRFFNQNQNHQAPNGDEDDNDDNDDEGGSGTPMALGSGFIVDPAGIVVTNNHVIQNADKIQVTIADGRKLSAHVLGKDDKTDIAVLKIDAKDPFPYVQWGDSNKTRVGDWVLAVGNPFGLGGSVTAGIISARGRDIQSGPYDDYLQVDAPINRGNSGGPSFNTDGQVIGINTAIYSPSGGSVGIGFAIPASVAKPIVEELRKSGHIDRGWLGVSIQPLTKDLADSLGLSEAKGALVAGVNEGSPAAKAGIHQGDVIRSVAGQKVDEFRDLARLVAAAGPDKTVALGVWRDGKQVDLPVALGKMPEQTASIQPKNRGEDHESTAKPSNVLGLSLAAVNRQTRQRYDLPDEAKGALIVGVKAGSPAADAGFSAGDIIVKVGDKAVAGPRDVLEAVRTATRDKRKAVLFLVQRGSNERFVALPVEAS
ncbi:MAG TPA: DegQ family serine endoprotease [Alphaproteobacteria bacterium]|nr:DegQ family serine endoprotease [Alphaproteobacteria bacterium]